MYAPKPFFQFNLLTSYNRPSIPGSPVQESPENVLNPLAIYRMARTALHEKDSGISTSLSPSTQSELSTAVLQPRAQPQHASTEFTSNDHPQGHQQDRSGQEMYQHDPPSHLSVEQIQGYATSLRQEDQSSSLGNNPSHFPLTGSGGAWDPADMAVMDMLNGGITPWTAEYLTDGQSGGVDPFLFPF